MQVQVTRTDLLKELQILGGVIDKRPNVPSTSHILCTAELSAEGTGGQLRLTATNLDTTVLTSCPAHVLSDGGGLLPGRLWVDIVRLMSGDEVVMRSGKDSGMQLQCGSARFRLLGPDTDSFPSLPERPAAAFGIAPGQLLSALEGVKFAVSRDEGRYNLTVVQGVLSWPGAAPAGTVPADLASAAPAPGRVDLRLVATDGHRLALAWLPGAVVNREGLLSADNPRLSFLLPRRGVQDLLRLLSDAPPGDADFGIGDRFLFFRVGHRQLWAVQGGGLFPSLDSVLQPQTPYQVVLPLRPLVAALRRLLPVADETIAAALLTFRAGQLEMSSQSSVVGDAVESMDIAYDGPTIEIMFNAHYLLDILGAMTTEQVMFRFKDEISAVELRPFSPETPAGDGGDVGKPVFRYIVMPLRKL